MLLYFITVKRIIQANIKERERAKNREEEGETWSVGKEVSDVARRRCIEMV